MRQVGSYIIYPLSPLYTCTQMCMCLYTYSYTTTTLTCSTLIPLRITPKGNRSLQRIVEETIRLQNQRGFDEGNNITDLGDIETTLKILVAEEEYSTSFSALESCSDHDTNDDRCVKSTYHSSHGISEETEEEALEQTPPTEVETKIQTPLEEAKTKIPTPLEEAEIEIPTPPEEAETESPTPADEKDW